MRRLFVVVACVGACGSKTVTLSPLGGKVDGALAGVTINSDSKPFLTTNRGPMVFVNNGWSVDSATGIAGVGALSFDSTGAMYASSDHLYRLPKDANAWQRFDTLPMGKTLRTDTGAGVFPSVPVEASDGTLYVSDADFLYYRGPGDAVWTPTGMPTTTQLVAGRDGNVWVGIDLALMRIRRTEVQLIPNAWPAKADNSHYGVVLLGMDHDSGRLIGAPSGYVPKYNYVYLFDPATGMSIQQADGSCDPGMPTGDEWSSLLCDNNIPNDGGFVVSFAVSKGGDVYEAYAEQNGGDPELFKLSQGDKTWIPIATLEDVWFRGAGLVNLVIAPDDTIYAYTTDYTGSYDINSGSYIPGTFLSYVYSSATP